jgi:hypothetical protein
VARLLGSAEVDWRTEQSTAYSSNLPVLLLSLWQLPVSPQMTTLSATEHRVTYNLLTMKHADDCRSSRQTGLFVSLEAFWPGKTRGGGVTSRYPSILLLSCRQERQKHPGGVNSCNNTDKGFPLWTTYQLLRFCSLSPCTQW